MPSPLASKHLALFAPAAMILALAAPAAAGHRQAPHSKAEPAPPPEAPCSAPGPALTDPLSAGGFGCASEANLRLMLAEPEDLQAGRPPAPPSGDAALAAVQRYRADQVKPLGGGAAAPDAGLAGKGGGR